MNTGEKLWQELFALAPARQPALPSTLYDVITGSADLETVKRYVAGGHALVQQFAGGHSVALAVRHGDLDFVRYFVDGADETELPPDLLADAVTRISQSDGDELETAYAVFEFLRDQSFAQQQLRAAYTMCAMTNQFSVAKSLLEAGLQDEEMRAGEEGVTTRLSSFLESCGKPDYAALLLGDEVDHDKLTRKEAAERRRNAKLKGAFDGLELAGQDYLQGQEFDECYKALLAEIDAGVWNEALASRDRLGSRTVVEFAAENGFTELARLFLRIDPLPPDEAERASRHAAKAAASRGHLDVLKVLKEAGVAVHETPTGHNSPLSEACRYGHLDVVRFLLDAGADPISGDGSGHEITLKDLAGGEARNDIIAALDAATTRGD